jgi:hypothetical protein
MVLSEVLGKEARIPGGKSQHKTASSTIAIGFVPLSEGVQTV